MDERKQSSEKAREAQEPQTGAGTERNKEEVGRPVELEKKPPADGGNVAPPPAK
ncbi:MAG TPA: hypothetical protein VGL09_17230 [Methylomirabilota bacterium]|jgi:hypothetical protein